MEETKTTTAAAIPAPTSAPAAGSARPAGSRPAGSQRGGSRGGGRGGQGGRRGGEREAKEFDQKTLDLSRVTRVTAGGKRMSFRAALVIGDKKGRVGFGVAKGSDVQISMDKAYRQAKKHMVKVPMQDGTIPHSVEMKFGSAVVLLKPAPKGTGLKSGGATRVVLELAGVPNAVSKVLNSSNKINIAKATLAAIEQLRMNPTKGKEKKAE
jgi:small subunit ribosomal protein S5